MIRQRILIAILSIALAGLAASITARDTFSYVFFSGYWSDVDDLTACVNTSYTPPSGSHSGKWHQALGNWNGSTAFDYSLTCSGEDITLTDINIVDGHSGFATWLPNCCSGAYTKAGGLLNYYWTQHYTANKVLSVAAHEMGHILSFDHEDDYCALMNGGDAQRYDTCGIYYVTIDEIVGFNVKY